MFIKGNQADANADFLRCGQEEVLPRRPAATSSSRACDIVNVGESYTDNWDPAVAQTNMEQFLTQNNNNVDAVVASNDGMAGGVVAALAAQGLAGNVPVSGQDGDAAALNRVALGHADRVGLEERLRARQGGGRDRDRARRRHRPRRGLDRLSDLGDTAPAAGDGDARPSPRRAVSTCRRSS